MTNDYRRQPFFWDYHEIFDAGLSKHALLVRLYLARCASFERAAFPSLNTIADKCGLSRKSVQRALDELVDKGWVERQQRKKPGTKEQTSNLYVLKHPDESMVMETIPYGHTDHTLWSDRPHPMVTQTTKKELYNKNQLTSMHDETPIPSSYTESGQDIPPVKEKKIEYAEFVSMTEKEYNKLVSKHGEDFTKQAIDLLNNHKGSKGAKYKSDYHAMLKWVVEALVDKQKKQPPNQPQERRSTVPGIEATLAMLRGE